MKETVTYLQQMTIKGSSSFNLRSKLIYKYDVCVVKCINLLASKDQRRMNLCVPRLNCT